MVIEITEVARIADYEELQEARQAASLEGTE